MEKDVDNELRNNDLSELFNVSSNKALKMPEYRWEQYINLSEDYVEKW